MTARVLVTGARLFTAADVMQEAIERAIDEYSTDIVIVHGAAGSGADELADVLAPALGLSVERWPADWERRSLLAGFERNIAMVDAGANLCLAFRVRGEACRGTQHCANYALRRHIPVRWYLQEALPKTRPQRIKGL